MSQNSHLLSTSLSPRHTSCSFFGSSDTHYVLMHAIPILVIIPQHFILTSTELTPKGKWEVTSVREDQEIYPDYAEAFSHTFPALVCVVLNYVWMAILAWIVFWWLYVLEQMSAHVHKQQQQVSAQDRQCCTDTGCAVIEFVACFHARLCPLEGNWP